MLAAVVFERDTLHEGLVNERRARDFRGIGGNTIGGRTGIDELCEEFSPFEGFEAERMPVLPGGIRGTRPISK